MQAAARARGYDLSALRARQFSAADFAAFDLIVAMDEDNLARIEALRGTADTPVRRFTDYAEGPEDHVPDPYFTDDYDGALSLIERCARGLLGAIAPAAGKPTFQAGDAALSPHRQDKNEAG